MVKNPRYNAGDARGLGLMLGRENPLEKEMATCCSILAWETPGTEEPWQPLVHGVTKSLI